MFRIDQGSFFNQRYLIEGSIAEGGFAAVYLALDSMGNKRKVALKFQPINDEDEKRQFELEVDALIKLKRGQALEIEHIPAIYDYGFCEENNEAYGYIALEYIQGKELIDLLPFSEEQILVIASKIARVLEYVHGQGIIHRDIKPSNILLTYREGRMIPMLIDFGIMKQKDDGTNSFVHGYGTLAYASPEQLRGNPTTVASDLYSFGATLYHLIEQREPTDVVTRLVENLDVLPFSSKISSHFRHIITTLLRLNPSERYQSAHDLWFDLNQTPAHHNRSSPIFSSLASSGNRLTQKLNQPTPALVRDFPQEDSLKHVPLTTLWNGEKERGN